MNKLDRIHKKIAQAEYGSYTIGWDSYTRESSNLIGTTLDFNDNRSGNGEQVFAIASDGSNVLPNASLNERVKVKKLHCDKGKTKYRKEESYEKEYISYTKYFNNYNIVWMSKERRSKYI